MTNQTTASRNPADQYELVADEYDMSFRLMPVRGHIEAYSVLRHAGDVTGLRVLDVACGTGFYARAMRRAGAARVVGIDLSEAMIEVARSAEKATELGIDYHVADASALERIGSFDLALCVYLLHYAPSTEALRAMCGRLADNLAPGGRLVAFSMNPEVATEKGAYQAYGLVLRVPDPEPNGCPIHFSIQAPGFSSPEMLAYRWNRDTYEAALRDAGFEQIGWHRPEVSPKGVEEHGSGMWGDYLARPHCMLLSATKASA